LTIKINEVIIWSQATVACEFDV